MARAAHHITQHAHLATGARSGLPEAQVDRTPRWRHDRIDHRQATDVGGDHTDTTQIDRQIRIDRAQNESGGSAHSESQNLGCSRYNRAFDAPAA